MRIHELLERIDRVGLSEVWTALRWRTLSSYRVKKEYQPIRRLLGVARADYWRDAFREHFDNCADCQRRGSPIGCDGVRRLQGRLAYEIHTAGSAR